MSGERVANVLLGCSVLAWAVLHLASVEGAERWALPRLAISALNVCAGVLFLVRAPLVRSGTAGQIVSALPSFLLAGAALKCAPPRAAWPWQASLLICAGSAFAGVALLWLGRSFALFPALREVVSSGPFRLVRHPAYLGESGITLGIAVAGGGGPATWLALAAIPAVLARLVAEERFLRSDPRWAAYAAQVRHRLLPGVW